jgi:hypothetical protein
MCLAIAVRERIGSLSSDLQDGKSAKYRGGVRSCAHHQHWGDHVSMNLAPPDDLEDDGLARALHRVERERDAEPVEAGAPECEAVLPGELGVNEVTEVAVIEVIEVTAGDADVGPDNVVPFPRPAVEAPAPVPAPVKPHDPGSSAFWWIPGGMLAAAAAAIVLWWVVPPSEDVRGLDNPVAAARQRLPGYVLETDGGLEELRGASEGEASPDDARHRYHRDTQFEWILRPKADFEPTVSVRAFAFVDGGSAGLPLQLDDLAKVASTGEIRISGKIAELKLEPGRYTIALAIGRAEDLPTEAETVLEDEDAEKFVVRRVDVVIDE